MFARITTAVGAPEKLHTGLETFRAALQANQGQIEALNAVYVLVDRLTGKHMTITLWATREAAETVSELPRHMQGTLVEAFAIAEPPTHAIYEVAIQAE